MLQAKRLHPMLPSNCDQTISAHAIRAACFQTALSVNPSASMDALLTEAKKLEDYIIGTAAGSEAERPKPSSDRMAVGE